MPSVTLRDVQLQDLDILFAQQLDQESIRMAAFTPKNPADRKAFDDRWERILADETLTKKVIVVGESVVGSVFCHNWYGQPEVGYWIDRRHWGRGYASEALRLLLEIVEDRPFYAMIAADNEASKRVVEKLGFVVDHTKRSYAEGRGEEIEEIVYVLGEGH